MKRYIVIKADTNDADYITSKHLITDQQLQKITPVIDAINNFKPYKLPSKNKEWENKFDHNFPIGECCRTDMGEKTIQELYGHLDGLEVFENFIPYYEYGIHTIKSIELLEVENEIKLL